MRYLLCLPFLMILFLCTSCASILHQQAAAPQSVGTPPALSSKLQKATRLVQTGEISRAQSALSSLAKTTLTPDEKIEYELLLARMALISKHPRRAVRTLTRLNERKLSDRQQKQYHVLMAQAYLAIGNPLESVRERIALGPYLKTPEAQEQNDQAIWQALQPFSAKALATLIAEPAPDPMTGWLKISVIIKRHNNDPTVLAQAVNEWRQQFPQHPAERLLAAQTHATPSPTAQPSLNQIALLLPLNGTLGKAGKAVKNGFFTAYYDSQNSKKPVIKVYNTANQNLQAVYQQAITEGANFVVGPLAKENVAQAVSLAHRTHVPLLALNYSPAPSSPFYASNGNVFEMGLSPRDEATLVATRAFQQSYRRTLLIYPEGAWGEGIVNAFEQQWQNLGGAIVNRLPYTPHQNLSKALKGLLHIDQSQSRFAALKKQLNQKMEFTLRRRKDFDMIFLVASPQTARQIKPLLKFYYADDIPVFATSSVYSGNLDPVADRDLEGIIFCDMPWTINPDQAQRHLKNNLSVLWPQSFKRYPRLYALGYDAYQLIADQELARLQILPNFGIIAQTGTLFLANQRLHRQLVWARMRHGKPIVQAMNLQDGLDS